ncbi:MAG: Smr/MutS family protein [Patescibacteria group bacterium]|nr:Smr/MutS family protein [Patescibacteria group bacterium]MDD4304719.1 Smr/MutS family protein [Patescibacteria group bacterium]MDD4695719.1 Smr/MutS family protein [Patescibacteria group bacterium]
MNKYYTSPEREIDLHGYTKVEAEIALLEFLGNCENDRCSMVRIITGKGLHSKNFEGVLGEHVRNFLHKEGYNFKDAKINDGGSGAIIVNL